MRKRKWLFVLMVILILGCILGFNRTEKRKLERLLGASLPPVKNVRSEFYKYPDGFEGYGYAVFETDRAGWETVKKNLGLITNSCKRRSWEEANPKVRSWWNVPSPVLIKENACRIEGRYMMESVWLGDKVHLKFYGRPPLLKWILRH